MLQDCMVVCLLTTSPGIGLVFCSAMGRRGRTEKQWEWRQLMHISSGIVQSAGSLLGDGVVREVDSIVAFKHAFLLFH